jgi:hypothetical protein
VADLIDPVSGWGSNVGGPALQTQLVDKLNDYTAESGNVASGIFTAGTGVTINAQTAEIIVGRIAVIRLNYTIGPTFPGVPITPPPSGDIGNIVVATISDSRFFSSSAFTDWPLATSAVGRVAAHSFRTATDDIVLNAVAGTANIANGDSFTLAGWYLLA